MLKKDIVDKIWKYLLTMLIIMIYFEISSSGFGIVLEESGTSDVPLRPAF